VNSFIDVPIDRVANKNTIVATITVTGLKWWMVRMWLATWLIRVASWIAPVGIKVEDE